MSELTGRAPSAGPGDDALYKKMLNNAASFAQEFGLRPGISLSPEQVSHLTSDIVWLESQTVQLPDGSIETVLVPKVYLAHVNANAVKPTGALVTGATVVIDVSETIMNQGGVIDSGNGRTILLAGEDIINRGGAIKGGDVTLQAGRDIKNETLTVDSKWSSKVNGGSYTSLSNQATISATNGLVMDAGRNLTDLAGTINAGGSASIFAGNNISFDTVKTGSTYHALIDGNAENNSAVYNQVSRVNVGGDLLMAATGNLNLAGTQVSIGTKGSGAGTLLAGGAVNINAVVDEVKTSLQDDKTRKSWGKDIHENQSVVGAHVASTGDLLVSAGISQSSDLNVTGSALAAGGTLTLKASKDLNIGSVAETHFSDMENHSKSGNKLKKSSSDITDYNATTLAIGSAIKGGNVVASSGGDTLIKGSTVLAEKDLSIDAKGGLKIVSAEETSKTSSTRQEKKSGFSVSYSSGNLSTGYGKSSTSSQSAQETVTQLASSIGALDGSVKLKSGETLQVVASDIAAKENLTLIGKNVDLAAAQNTSVSQLDTQSKSSGFAVGFTVNPVKAFKDAYKSSTENSKSGSFFGKEFAKAEGAAEGGAAAVAVVNTQFGNKSANSTQNHATSEARTSTLLAGKDLTILATDGSITSQGAQISAEGNALIVAKDDIKFDVAHTTETRSQDSKKSGFSIDTRSTQIIGTLHNKSDGNGATDTVTGTKLSVGGSTTMATQTGDIALTGANVVSDGKLSISAARDLTITSAQDTLHNANQSDNKAIGKVVISDTERFSGYHNEKHKDNSDQVTQVASNVSSLKGDVNLTAGQKYTQASSNVLAGNDVNITAKSIDITALQNTGSHQESNSDLKIGAFARISSPLIDLANNVEAAHKSDGRLKEMQRMAATANGYQAVSAIRSMTGGPGSGILVKGEAGVGFASSSNSSNGNDSTAQGSSINGGRNVTLTATGGDIHATGATLNAGKTLNLDAAQNIVLDASQSTLHSDGKNRSSGVEAGVGFQVGAQTGVYFYAAANVGKGHNKNDVTINNNTQLKADTINISSKGDTTLKGATATANTINTDVGGKLAIESLQDTSQFESVQTNAGVRVQVAIGNAWNASGNISQQRGSGTYAGVGQQSGLFAGDGGYHVKADTIDLKGGAIASTNAAASELTTNKLTTSDIENKMKYSASNVSVAGGTGGSSKLLRDEAGNILPLSQQAQAFGTAKDGNAAPGMPTVERGSDSSTTFATVTDGKITIGGVTTNSVKDLGINNDLSKANTALDKLPDLQKLLKDQQAMSAAAGTVIATGKQITGDIAIGAANAQKAAQETLKDPKSTAEQRAAATKQFEEAQQTLNDWGTGGIYSRALNAGVSVLTGAVAGQGGGQITANAIAPTVAKMVGDIGTDLQNEARAEADRLTGLAQQAADRGDTVAAAEYSAKAREAATTAANWGDNGAYRVGLHAATQGMLGGLASGQSGALESAAGVVGGNLGQQLGAQLGNAEADKLGLKGEEKRAFVNAFQQTGAAVGGMIAGVAAGNPSGGAVDAGSLLAAARGGQAAGTVDTFNRTLHAPDYENAKRISKKSKGIYTEKQILNVLRLSGITDGTNLLVEPGRAESFTVRKEDGFVFDNNAHEGWKPMSSIPGDMRLEGIPGAQLTLREVLPSTPDAALIEFIQQNMGGKASPYVFAKTEAKVDRFMFPAPEASSKDKEHNQLTRTTVIVDGVAYQPLRAECPLGCFDSIAWGTDSLWSPGTDDPQTRSYGRALNQKIARDGIIGFLSILNPFERGFGLIPASSRTAAGAEATAIGREAGSTGSGAFIGYAGERSVSGLTPQIGSVTSSELDALLRRNSNREWQSGSTPDLGAKATGEVPSFGSSGQYAQHSNNFSSAGGQEVKLSALRSNEVFDVKKLMGPEAVVYPDTWNVFDPTLNRAFHDELIKFGNSDLVADPKLRGGEGQLFLSNTNPNLTLKRWYETRVKDLNQSVVVLQDAGAVVRQNPSLSETLDVVKIYDRGPDWVLRDFYPDSMPLRNALGDDEALAALLRTRDNLKNIDHPALLDLTKRLNREKPSANFHWSPVKKTIIWIDGI